LVSPPPDPDREKPCGRHDPTGGIVTYVYGSHDQVAGIDTGAGPEPVRAPLAPSPRLFRWEHLKDKRRFALTDLYGAKAGETEYWRDNPTRYLVVEVDDETGEFKPAVKHRQPVYLWLCREESEARRVGGT
jgi:hypothetical protein